jgi:glycosyltransferase involved in cell wall biosynthesis
MADVRVAYTLEQCWHRVPGGTAVAALEVADALARTGEVEVVGVAGHHRSPPIPPWRPSGQVHHLGWPWRGPLLYEGWLRLGRPSVESATGPVDVAHATTIIPCASTAPLVVTVHDLAFLHEPAHFTRRGVSVFRRSLEVIRRRADLVLCSSEATLDDVAGAGVGAERLRHVPLGVASHPAAGVDVAGARQRHGLPDAYLLFVGTLEPRKNLRRLAAAVARLEQPLPLVVVGASGWGESLSDLGAHEGARVQFLGFVPAEELPAIYAGAAAFCFPSLREGYGLPVLEAMSQGVPVVTSRGTSTEEVAGGAAVLVDPRDIDDIARGITDALSAAAELGEQGRQRASTCTWERTASLTVDAYRQVAAS